MPNTKLEGSRTLQNLVNAFAGESQARNRYTYFSKIAKKEGYEQIAAIFLETAENEKEHAKLFYQEIGNIKYNVNAKYPFELGTTEENLESAIAGELEEWDSLYPESERIAREEGFDKIAEYTSNHDVKTLQNRLNGLYQEDTSLPPLKEDWILGKKTTSRIKKALVEFGINKITQN